jgi:hypothetical protein
LLRGWKVVRIMGSWSATRAGKSGGENENIPDAIKAKVQKVRDMAKRSPYGDLEGDVKVSRDKDGNYNLSYTQVRNYGRIKSDTIGVGDIPARKEITRTTRVMDSMGRKINIIRKTETEYSSSVKRKRRNAT